ncbi:MAG: hypothetical protein WC480_00670 [Patescibacteria group bacterium]
MPNCKNCQQNFTITEADRQFYRKMEVPEPTMCFPCRLQNLMAYRNERVLYPAICGLCKKSILAAYPPTHPTPIYCYECWHTDKWDSTTYGQDYDSDRSFFEQYEKLQNTVPPFALSVFGSINSDYTNCASWNKNSYLVSGANYNEDVLYGNYVNYDKYSLDISFTHKSELCYEITDGENNYHVRFATDSSNCSDCSFIHDCRNCVDCFCCTNLRNAKYCILNKPYNEADYRKKMAAIDLGSYQTVQQYLGEFKQLKLLAVYQYYHGSKNENSTGDYFYYTKDCHYCFDATEVEGCAYLQWFHKARNCYDILAWGFGAENCYSGVEVGDNVTFLKFTRTCRTGSSNLEYCQNCIGCTDCFGCYCMHNVKYCILNKQYLEKEYRELKEKIIAKTKSSGEYGEFFPTKYSYFGYNETIANDYFPLTREEVLKRGWHWQDKMPGIYDKGTLTADQLPNNIKEVEDNITKEILVCASCGKNYKITLAELKLYKQITVPLPRQCFDCRHLARLKQRNPRQLWHRQCLRPGCKNEFETTYAPDRSEKVYCEECYQKEIY